MMILLFSNFEFNLKENTYIIIEQSFDNICVESKFDDILIESNQNTLIMESRIR